MSRILLVEPYRILQQAIALSLASDHQVEVRQSIMPTELSGLQDCDLLVLDASSLEEKKQLTPELLQALEKCATPLLWLEDEPSLERPATEKFQALKKPLGESTLKAAIESLLGPQNRDRRDLEAEKTSSSNGSPAKGAEEKTAAAASRQPSAGLIDLVEVVAEPGLGNRGRASKKGN